MKRRDFLRGVAAGTAAFGFALRSARATPPPDLVIHLTAAPDAVPIRAGAPTRVLRYRARVLEGRPDAVRPTGTYLGPTLDLRAGERVRILFDNRAGESSIVHWHGLIVPEAADGHPRFAIPSGERYVYDFTVQNPAGTYLYHPHPHGRTGYQVYHGLAGLLVVREEREAAAGLPSGARELPLVLQDRRFDEHNQLVFSDGMMDRMHGVLGDTVLVNGRADAAFTVSRGGYRLRVLNASNARIYKLAWSDGRPMHVVAADNGLLDASAGVQTRPYVVLGVTERVDILEDFGARPGGTEVALVSQPFDSGAHMRMMGGGMMGGGMMGGGMMGGGMMGGGMMGGNMGASSQGREMLVARFSVRREPRQAPPEVALPAARPGPGSPERELVTRLAFRHMRGFLDGRDFEMTSVARDERVPRNRPILWTFEHDERGMGLHMPHPMHIHGVRFRVVERERGPGAPAGVAEGYVDEGYKDTVLVFPGERVRVLLVPTEPGLFMYHCHNLEHEDGGMMRNYLVEA